jgi:hypothetical protein
MNWVFTYVTVCILVFSTQAFAEDLSSATDPLPPGTFTSHQHSDEWLIKNALSAGPDWITDKATVKVMDMHAETSGGGHMMERVLRRGSNGWTCMPDVPGRPQHDPMCGDETMMKWLKAVMAGEKPNIDRVGLSYMLMGEARQGQNVPPAKDPSKVKEWFYIGPHIMIVLPDSDTAALRDISQDLAQDGAYATSINHSPNLLWVIPVGKKGERIKSYPPGQNRN